MAEVLRAAERLVGPARIAGRERAPELPPPVDAVGVALHLRFEEVDGARLIAELPVGLGSYEVEVRVIGARLRNLVEGGERGLGLALLELDKAEIEARREILGCETGSLLVGGLGEVESPELLEGVAAQILGHRRRRAERDGMRGGGGRGVSDPR